METYIKIFYWPAVSIAGCFGFVALLLSLFLTFQHLQWYTRLLGQKWIVAIIFMVPVYATESIISLCNAKLSLAFDILRNCYEAFDVYAFGSYLVPCVGNDFGITQIIVADGFILSVLVEFLLFILTATLGGMLLCDANDLITIFVALECFSLCSYLLSGALNQNLESISTSFCKGLNEKRSNTGIRIKNSFFLILIEGDGESGQNRLAFLIEEIEQKNQRGRERRIFYYWYAERMGLKTFTCTLYLGIRILDVRWLQFAKEIILEMLTCCSLLC